MVYVRCRNCGCYLITSGISPEGYCGSDCSERYRSCANCGGYYLVGTGYRDRYCCPECAVQYKMSRYPDETARQGLMEELA
jgi:hypothetical protein